MISLKPNYWYDEKCHFSLGLSSINYHIAWLQQQQCNGKIGVPHLRAHQPKMYPEICARRILNPTQYYLFFVNKQKEMYILEDNEFVIILHVCKILKLCTFMHFKIDLKTLNINYFFLKKKPKHLTCKWIHLWGLPKIWPPILV